MHMLAKRRTAVLLVLPGVAVITFAIVAPIILSVSYSLTQWSGFGERSFIGLQNYRRIIFADPTFWRALVNALLLLLVTVFIQNPIAIFVAGVLIELREKTSRLLRTIYFVPSILTVVVAVKLWTNVLNPHYGLFNKLLEAIGLARLVDISWLSDPTTALGAVIFITAWHGFGWALLFYYSGLTTVPNELREAAQIDGANRFQIVTRITVPYILPVIQAVIIIDITASLKQMEVVFLSTGGGPGDRTEFIAHYLYREAFVASRFGYGNAISILFVAIAITMTLLAQRYLTSVRETR